MVVRLSDKDHKIRAQAAEALCRVQDENDQEDTAIVGLTRSIQADPAKYAYLAINIHCKG